ncbi:MAG: helix-turn-helix domain-containing protein, partial [Eudoraea sp.]|uniref:helix-turn-helix domain-containing protein n=1 Tax=Eudoraea sp. TaxID=1979955 RepID=UPI003C71E68C
PLLWYYTLFLTQTKQKLTKEFYIHLAPFFVAMLYLWTRISMEIQTGASFRNFLLFFKLFSILNYTILILRLLKKHDLRIRDYFSNLDNKKLLWLKFLAEGILVIAIIACVSLLIENFTLLSLPQYGGLFTNISICVFIFILGYYGLRQDFIFKDFNNSFLEKVKYSKSSLNEEHSRSEFLRLQTYMRMNKPYIEPELNLETLAQELDLHPNNLSQIVNSNTESNFWDYINSYRIEEVKAILVSDEIKSKTLLGIALSSGFSSKSTFNRVFKKHCGITPSEYILKQKALSKK